MFQILINIILSFSLISLVGVSFYYVFNTGKYYAIHHASIIALGGYLLAFFYQLDIPFYWSIISSIGITTLLGVLIQKLILFGSQKAEVKPFYLIIVSLGVYIIIQNLISIFFGDDLKIINIKQLSKSIQISMAYITVIQIVTVVINLLIIFGSLFLFKTTILGKRIKALSNNKELSKIFGVNTNKIILWSFGIGSLIAGISGILITLNVGMDNYSSFNLLFYGVIAIIIGGIGNFKGLIIGALILAISQNLTAYYIDSKWTSATAYIILIVFLYFKPYGFSGKKLKKANI